MADETQGQSVTDEVANRISAKVLNDLLNRLDDRLAGLEIEYKGLFERAQAEAAKQLEARATDLLKKLADKDNAAQTNVNAINTAKGTAEQTAKQINDYSTQSKTALDTTNQNRDKVVSLGQRADELNEEITKLKEQVTNADDEVATFGAQWEAKLTELFTRIEGLLPGATGAGLASGFHDEKEAYERKQIIAHCAFVGFLILLVATLVFTPLQVFVGRVSVGAPIDALDLLKRMLWNLPIVAPAIWGAWWFNRLASLYDRLAEEYRQKEAISKAFDGYTKHIDGLKGLANNEVLSSYLKNALSEICLPAGRVFDKKMPPGTPWEDQLEKVAAIIVDRMTKGNLLAKT